MKFKDYLEKINALAKQYPEALAFDVIYAEDDEGNGFCRGVQEPSLAKASGEYRCELYFNDEDEEELTPNVVIIN